MSTAPPALASATHVSGRSRLLQIDASRGCRYPPGLGRIPLDREFFGLGRRSPEKLRTIA